MSFTYGGLFSGVGMLEYACQQLGGRGVFMAEMDPFCQRVLARRFPGEMIFSDVHDVTEESVPSEIDVLVGGFPCQDISGAGRGAGIEGSRSGLWSEFARVIDELSPSVVLIENVSILRSRGLDVVLSDLLNMGYNAEWDVIPAAAVGAPHLRERIWIIARPAGIAQNPVYGEISGGLEWTVKFPRAGRASEEELSELVPIAKCKSTRKDGWSYWAGVLLFGEGRPVPWPTAQARDGIHGGPQAKRFLDKQRSNDLDDAVAARGALLPTPCANDDGKSPDAHMAMKSRLAGGPRKTITSLAVLARNDFKQAGDGHLWPSPMSRDWKDDGPNVNYDRIHARSGLAGSVQVEQRLWSASTTADGTGGPGRSDKRTGGDNLRTQADGSLNPTWVEWLMGMPLWWTDPRVPTSFCTPVGWGDEPLHVAPRVAREIPKRADRLKAIGNSCVWLCAYFALERALAVTDISGG
jgi:site-specific DNA-cytosine methylase